MFDAGPILPALMAEMLFDGGVRLSDVASDTRLAERMAATLTAWRVRPSRAPDDLPAVREALAAFWGEAASERRTAA